MVCYNINKMTGCHRQFLEINETKDTSLVNEMPVRRLHSEKDTSLKLSYRSLSDHCMMISQTNLLRKLSRSRTALKWGHFKGFSAGRYIIYICISSTRARVEHGLFGFILNHIYLFHARGSNAASTFFMTCSANLFHAREGRTNLLYSFY